MRKRVEVRFNSIRGEQARITPACRRAPLRRYSPTATIKKPDHREKMSSRDGGSVRIDFKLPRTPITRLMVPISLYRLVLGIANLAQMGDA